MERLTRIRPTEPYRADCGHLCNCFPFTHEGQQWYEHDFFPTYENNVETGTECGPCYRARMERETAGWTMQDVVHALGGR